MDTQAVLMNIAQCIDVQLSKPVSPCNSIQRNAKVAHSAVAARMFGNRLYHRQAVRVAAGHLLTGPPYLVGGATD